MSNSWTEKLTPNEFQAVVNAKRFVGQWSEQMRTPTQEALVAVAALNEAQEAEIASLKKLLAESVQSAQDDAHAQRALVDAARAANRHMERDLASAVQSLAEVQQDYEIEKRNTKRLTEQVNELWARAEEAQHTKALLVKSGEQIENLGAALATANDQCAKQLKELDRLRTRKVQVRYVTADTIADDMKFLATDIGANGALSKIAWRLYSDPGFSKWAKDCHANAEKVAEYDRMWEKYTEGTEFENIKNLKLDYVLSRLALYDVFRLIERMSGRKP